MKVFDDPDWRFEWFGTLGKTLGGEESTGIRRHLEDEVCFSEIINGKLVMRSRGPVEVP